MSPKLTMAGHLSQISP